ncbi:MAG: OsmC family protein [Kofleriaceae bacterium]|nr:OsmC family protein [Kofleriaceae bacterium]
MTTVRCETITPGDYPVTVKVRTHELRSDLSTDSGGADAAAGAHDFFDISLATCKAHTAMWYAKRKGIPLERVEATVESDASQERAGIYKLTVRLAFHGAALTAEHKAALQRAVGACPIHKLMTTTDVQIETVTDDV